METEPTNSHDSIYPVMSLPGSCLLPTGVLPLYIFEERFQKMLEEALSGDRMFCIGTRVSGEDTPLRFSSLGLIRACVTRPDGTAHLILHGLRRVEFVEWFYDQPYDRARVRSIPTEGLNAPEVDDELEELRSIVREQLLPQVVNSDSLAQHLETIEDPESYADTIACNFVSEMEDLQVLLGEPRLGRRLGHLRHMLSALLENSQA
ncbi:MAG: LON peptidase substrate-binding domain-containing protein [Verrucomicrobiota bacterium]